MNDRRWVIAFYTAVVVFAFLIFTGFEVTAEICEKAQNSGQYECPRYSLLFYLLWWLRKISEFSVSFFTIVSGLAIAAFTATLWRSTSKLWETSEGANR